MSGNTNLEGKSVDTKTLGGTLDKNLELSLKIYSCPNASAEMKTVSCIFLGYFEEGLKFCVPGSYEHIYILYKLGRYRRALRLCKSLEGRYLVLRAQILYRMGYFGEAGRLYGMVSGAKARVNEEACKSLERVGEPRQVRAVGVKRYGGVCGDKDACGGGELDAETRVEVEYNRGFVYANDENLYVKNLEMQAENVLALNQLKNMRGFFHSVDKRVLSAKQLAILEENASGRVAVHFPYAGVHVKYANMREIAVYALIEAGKYKQARRVYAKGGCKEIEYLLDRDELKLKEIMEQMKRVGTE